MADAEDVPELRPILERLMSDEARLRVALELFGDQGHPQPADRSERVEGIFSGGPSDRFSQTPDWGRLPRLEDVEGSEPPDVPWPTSPAPVASEASGDRRAGGRS